MAQHIICSSTTKIPDLSMTGVQPPFPDPLGGDTPDEPCDLTYEDEAHYVDADDRDDDVRPDAGGVMRLSEAHHFHFWTYFNRFVRYWPKSTFHVKYAYHTGFVEKKKRLDRGKSLPLFEALAVEMTERHLNAGWWCAWRACESPPDPVWLALHMPRLSTVDLIDVDAKQYRIGYYREDGAREDRLMPVVHLPLDHLKRLKRIYDAFPGRIWCISSETLGIHAWKKHATPQPTALLHQRNKERLAQIGEGSTEAHPMPGRCLRRPFGDGYRTVTLNGVCEDWIEQVVYFEEDGRTPPFRRICVELVKAMCRQWQRWECQGDDNRKVDVRSVLEKHRHELKEAVDWLKAGCPLDPVVATPVTVTVNPSLAHCRDVRAGTLGERPEVRPTPLLRICRAILAVSFGEQTAEDIAPILDEASAEIDGAVQVTVAQTAAQTDPLPTSENKRAELASLRGGKWATGLLRLARTGLEQDDSVATVAHEMAKWLWWIELYNMPEASRLAEITKLLTAYVLKKHNGRVSRLLNGQQDDVLSQITRCVKQAADISLPSSLEGFARTREKWRNGGYKHPVRLVPALTGQKEVSLSPPCQFTVMCIKFDAPLPESVQARIKAVAGRNKLMPFATALLNLLYTHNGRAFVGRKTLTGIQGYKNPNQIAKYTGILERAGVIRRGTSYKAGRNGKEFVLSESVLTEMHGARSRQAS